MYSTDCLAARKSISVHPAAAGPFIDISDGTLEEKLASFVSHVTLMADLFQGAKNWQAPGLSEQTAKPSLLVSSCKHCLMRLARSASKVENIPQKILIKSSDSLSLHDQVSGKGQCCYSPGTFITLRWNSRRETTVLMEFKGHLDMFCVDVLHLQEQWWDMMGYF